MNCPHCKSGTSEVVRVATRIYKDVPYVQRRRRCTNCSQKFTTYETADLKTLASKVSSLAALMKAITEMKLAVEGDE
tara:strand:+ start:2485 stop:2715 length:231 start_codon:yes stop_codon:yes gene_type:complete